jgi:ketosteroid isomerase-like protein
MTALQIAKDYFAAVSAKDLETALSHVADDIVCDAPPGRLEGKDAYRAFLAPFVGMLKEATLLAVFADDDTAMIMYDSVTVPVAKAPGAECLTIRDGKIIRSTFIFDRLPFAEARQAAATA